MPNAAIAAFGFYAWFTRGLRVVYAWFMPGLRLVYTWFIPGFYAPILN